MRPTIFGILNVTRDSFSDGGAFFDPQAALAHAYQLRDDGADVIDVGPASTHPDAEDVDANEEIRRLAPVLEALRAAAVPFSVDTYHSTTQRFALEAGACVLNDIQGFSDASFYEELSRSEAALVVMHSVQQQGGATRVSTDASQIVHHIEQFFTSRIDELTSAGVERDRLQLDPGMGFFLGSDPACSFEALRCIPRLRQKFSLPIFISVSRKSFLRAVVERDTNQSQAATLAAELFAVTQGASSIRTHAPAPLVDALKVWSILQGGTKPSEL